MYSNPHEIIAKVCKTCGNSFDSKRYFNKEYCSVHCRRRAKSSREFNRERELAITHGAVTKDERFFAQVSNPTDVQLEKYAELLKVKATNGKPIQFTGELPFWQPPSGIILGEQIGLIPRQWTMMTEEMLGL